MPVEHVESSIGMTFRISCDTKGCEEVFTTRVKTRSTALSAARKVGWSFIREPSNAKRARVVCPKCGDAVLSLYSIS